MRADCWREDEIERGTRVRLRAEAFGYGRPHLLWHARQGDIGVVSGPSKQSPAMARLYIIVHFEQCGHDHRLTDGELEVVRGDGHLAGELP